MTDVDSYTAALRAIWERSDYDRGFVSNPFAGDAAAGLGLRRTAGLLDRLGRPHERYDIVHVAGSNGKGSTCAFVTSILGAAGHRVGTYTQPHLHSFRERIAVNGEPIDEAAFAVLTGRALTAVEALERDEPELGLVTAFELTTAMALDHFAAAGCAVAVVEVGLGGTLDATNVVTPAVAALTSLDLEHTAVLGATLPEIALQKAGIIKPGRPVVVAPQRDDALAVIARVADRAGSEPWLGGRDWRCVGDWETFDAEGPWGLWRGLRSGLVGSHQIENAGIAIAATWLLGRSGWTVTEEAIRAGLAAARWPGRCELIRAPEGVVLVDGAHTPAAARVLARAVRDLRLTPAVVLLAVLRGKDPAAIAVELAPVAARFVVATPRGPRGLSAGESVNALARAGLSVTEAADLASGLTAARAWASEGAVVVAGSLTTVAETRELLGLARPDPVTLG